MVGSINSSGQICGEINNATDNYSIENKDSLPFRSLSSCGNVEQTTAIIGSDVPTAGIETAFAYGCLQDTAAYDFAHKLLTQLDVLVGKLCDKKCADSPDKLTQLLNRYAGVYGREGMPEPGSCGLNSLRIRNVLEKHDPATVSLREKMSLIHKVMEWLPQEIQRASGCMILSQQQAASSGAVKGKELQERTEKIASWLATLALDFPVSADAVARFSQYLMGSPTVRDFHAQNGRITNTLAFNPRPDIRTSPWIPRPECMQKIINIAQWEGNLSEIKIDAEWRPKFESPEGAVIRGIEYYTLNPDLEWFKNNQQTHDLITMTGPSSTTDVFIRLMNIFEYDIATMKAGLKALIAHMHLDQHHSIHEIMLAADVDSKLHNALQWQGKPKDLQQLDPVIYQWAITTKSHFSQMENVTKQRVAEVRNRLFSQNP